MDEKENEEPFEPGSFKRALAKLAIRLGGYDKVRKLTLPQVQLMLKGIVEEQLFLAKIHGCETKEEEKQEFTTFSNAFDMA